MQQNALNLHRFQRWNIPNLDDIDNLITALSQLKVQREPDLNADGLLLAMDGPLHRQQRIAPDDVVFTSPSKLLLHFKLLQPQQTQDYDKLIEILERSREVLLDTALRSAPDIESLLLEEDQVSWVAQAGALSGNGGLFTAVCDEALANCSLAAIGGSPCTVVACLLEREACQHLLADVMAHMQWYVPTERQYTPGNLMAALLRSLLRHQLDPTGDTLGFDFNALDLEGLSYQSIDERVQDHLIHAAAVTSPKLAALAVWALKPGFPAEFQAARIPADLAYRTSTQWVRYAQGVSIAQAVKPESCAGSDFATLFGLPTLISTDPDPDVQLVCAAAKAMPILLWARAQGILERKPLEQYSPEDARLAQARFDGLEQGIETAGARLSAAMPDRIKRAEAELKSRQLKPDLIYIPRHTRIPAPGPYVQDHLQSSRRALDLVASGKLSGVNPGWVVPPFYAQGSWHERIQQDYNLPDINAEFEQDFTAWSNGRETSARLMLEWLLGNLPALDRECLGTGTLTVFTVRHIGPETSKYTRAARVGYQAFVIESSFEGRFHYYEVHPNAALVRRRDDLAASFNTSEGWRVRAGRWQPFDWDAYLTGAAPKEDSFSQVVLDAELTLAPTGGATAAPQLQAIADFAAALAARYHCAVYPQAKGVTVFDKVDPAFGLFKALVPFWSAVEELYQGIVARDKGQIFWGVLGVAADIVSFWAAGVKAITLAARLLKVSIQTGVQAAIKTSRRLAQQLVVELIKALDPVVGLTRLLAKGAIRTLKFGKDVIVALRKGVAHLARHFGTGSHLLRGLAMGKLAHQKNLQYRSLFGQAGVAVHVEHGLFNSRAHYRVEAITQQPFGPRLTRLSDKGAVGVLAEHSLPLRAYEGHWLAPDPAPHVSKVWIAWGDDLYLTWPGATFKRVLSSDGTAYLRRVRNVDASAPMTRIQCRTRRNGELSLCAPNTFANSVGQQPSPTTTGRDAVPWFDGIKCSADASNQLVYQNHRWTVQGQRLIRQSGLLRVAAYKRFVSAQVIGGNELFKRIQIQGGVIDGIEDMREIGAVTLLHRASGQQHLVTRVGRGVYYKGVVEAGQAKIALNKFRGDPQALGRGPGPLSDEDFLVAIYEGSHDANVYIRQHGLDVIKKDLDHIKNAIDEGKAPLMAPYLNGPFDLGTTVEQGALFCKYARTGFLHELTSVAAYKHPLTALTPLAVRQGIADTLNVLYRDGARFNPTNLLNARFMGQATGPKNLAFLKLKFRPGQQPSEQVFYSLSGFKRRNESLPLTLERASLLRSPQQPWHLQGNALAAPDGTLYLDVQPSRAGRPDLLAMGKEDVLFLPDLSNPAQMAGINSNQRLLDSERNILRHLERTSIDLGEVETAELFTRLPTCQSCTLLMEGLSQKMPPGTFKVYEGPGR